MFKIHTNLWGPAPITSFQQLKYYVSFIDDCTCFTWMYPLKRKSDFYACFKQFERMVENQFVKKIKIFQFDGGGEFSNGKFVKYLHECGILHQMSCPGTPKKMELLNVNIDILLKMG